MDEMELAQRLAEALRLYSDDLKSGQYKPWLGLLNSGSVDMTVSFNGDRVSFVPIVKPQPAEPAPQPVVEDAPADAVPLPEDSAPKRRRKTT